MGIFTLAAGLGSAAYGAIGSAVGTVGSAALNAYSQHRTNAINREQAEYAFRQQQLAIQRANEYNSPAQQVLRMKAAGLNPALAYGADGAMVGNQADTPAYSPIPAEAPNIGNVGAGIADAIRTGIDVRALEIQQAVAQAEIALKDTQSFLNITAGNVNEQTLREMVTMLGYKVERAESEIQLNWENVLKTRQEISNLKAQKDEILSRIGLNEEQMKLLAAQTGLTEMQCYRLAQLLPHEIANMDAQTGLYTMQTNLSQEQILSLDREMMHVNFVERLEREKFDFEKGSWQVAQRKWEAEYRAERVEHFEDVLVRLFTFGLGASALRGGQPLPRKVSAPRAPVAGNYGNEVRPAVTKPVTNHAGQRIGRSR